MTATTVDPQPVSSIRAASIPVAAARDLRLDFFRGLAMFFILLAHIPYNIIGDYVPSHWGWSDAAEIFVFCSGMASALAFGKIFTARSWWIGTARVGYRIWQVYWAHIGLFLAVATTLAAIDLSGIFVRYGAFEKDYVSESNLAYFFSDPERNLVALMTLAYVPNYFDILPMYMAILAMVPVAMALERIHPVLAIAASVALWSVAQTGLLDLSAEPWSGREWFFNPFAWQILFFTGFGFARGWLPVPPVRRWLVWLAVVFLLVSVPFSRWQIYMEVPWIEAWRTGREHLFFKTNEGILRYAHFLALAYVAWVAAGPGGSRIRATAQLWGGAVWARMVAVVLTVGQQSLAVFVFSMWLALMLGFLLDFTPARGIWPTLAVNILGIVLVSVQAYVVGWFKSSPWRARPGG